MSARRATDRDLESVGASFCANIWTRARRATDRDLESSSTIKKVNAWTCAFLTTDHDPASVIPDKKRKSVIFVILCGPMFFGIYNRRKSFPFTFFYLRNVFGINFRISPVIIFAEMVL